MNGLVNQSAKVPTYAYETVSLISKHATLAHKPVLVHGLCFSGTYKKGYWLKDLLTGLGAGVFVDATATYTNTPTITVTYTDATSDLYVNIYWNIRALDATPPSITYTYEI